MNDRVCNLTNMIMCGFFACLTGIFSQIVIPVGPIPINLATMSVLMAGGLLGPKWGAVSQLVYTALGAFGVPVFTQFTAGLGILTGPTGGYIAGYIFSAFTVGFLSSLIEAAPGEKSTAMAYLPYAAGIPACYIPGTLWFMYLTGSSLTAALAMCVFPFLIGDLLKVLCAKAVVQRVKPYLKYA